MAIVYDGGPAFPTDEYFDQKKTDQQPGISKRDFFANRALPFCCMAITDATLSIEEHARWASERAYVIADAMMQARKTATATPSDVAPRRQAGSRRS